MSQEENEDVVQKILEGFPDWDVQLPPCLRTWTRRGLPTPVSIELTYSNVSHRNIIFLVKTKCEISIVTNIAIIGSFGCSAVLFDQVQAS